jgi:hypothetical protein
VRAVEERRPRCRFQRKKKIALIGPSDDAEELVGCCARASRRDIVSLAIGIHARSYRAAQFVARLSIVELGGKTRKHIGDFKPIVEHPTGSM